MENIKEQPTTKDARGASELKALLGVRYSVGKIKIIRTIVDDWKWLITYSDNRENEPTMRQFVEENFCDIMKQAEQCDSWRMFYRTYKYT